MAVGVAATRDGTHVSAASTAAGEMSTATVSRPRCCEIAIASYALGVNVNSETERNKEICRLDRILELEPFLMLEAGACPTSGDLPTVVGAPRSPKA